VTGTREEFLDRYRETAPALYGYLWKACAGERERVEDLLQETYAVAITVWQRGRPDDVVLPWLLTVARNKLIDAYRREEREARKLARLGSPVDVTDPFGGAASEHVFAAIRSLPPLQRAVITLRFVDDLSLAETARLLGKRVAAIDSLQRRALQALREILREDDDDDR